MAGTPHATGIGLLLEHAEAADLRPLLTRAADALRPLLGAEGPRLPLPLALAMLDEGGQAAAPLGAALSRDPRLRAALAATGRPAVARLAWRSTHWSLRDLRTLLAAADPADPGWTAPRGPVEHLLRDLPAASGLPPALRASVVAPFPALVRHALLRAARTPTPLTRAERLRALLSLHTRGGPRELAALLREPDLREALGDAADDAATALHGPEGVAVLRAAVAHAEGTAGAVEELYASPTEAETILSLRATLDWAAVRGAHERRPFDRPALDALAARPDLPDDVLPALCAAHPAPEALLERVGRPVPPGFLDALPPAAWSAKLLVQVVRTSLDRTVRGGELLRARPAAAVLQAAGDARRPGCPARAGWAEFRAALAAPVARLGTDPAAWRVLRSRLGRFRGSVTDLVDDALARAAKGEGAQGPWPDAAGRPDFTENVVLKGARAAFLTVLDAAEPAAQWELLRHLDDRTAYDLLVLGTWRPEWLDLALAEDRRGARALLARHRDIPAKAVTALAALDDPAVNAGLVYQRHATWDQRLDLVTGVPSTPGRTGRLPMDEAVRDDLITTTRRDKKVWIAPWAASGDPVMFLCALESISLSSRHLQLRLLFGRWDRLGPEGLAEEIPDWFADSVRDTVTALLERPDHDAALAELRARVKDAGSARQLARRMRQWNNNHDLEWLLAEGYAWDWNDLLAEHRRSPLPDHRLRELAALDDCPDPLRERVGRMSKAEQRAYDRLLAGEPPAKVLPKAPLSPPGPGVPWTRLAEQRGLLTPTDLLHHARPARLALEAAEPALTGRTPAGEAAREELSTLIRKHLTGHQDTWPLTLRLLPDFTGTVPELLETVSHIVH